MLYQSFKSTPVGRRTIGYVQVLMLVAYIVLNHNGMGLDDWFKDFFMPNHDYWLDESYRGTVKGWANFFSTSFSIALIIYGVRGLNKIVSAPLAGTKHLEQFRFDWVQGIRDINILEPDNPGRPGIENHKNIDSLVDYVEGVNHWTDRKGSLENYAAIAPVAMMDKSTKDYLNGKLSWMSRKNGLEYMKNLNNK